jgi:hypothetical protein
MRLDAPVSRLKGVGPKAAALFAEKDIYTVGDLLRFYPSGYDEMTEPVPAAEAENGGFATLCLTIVGQGRIFRKGARVITHFEASDGTARVRLTFFNMPYVRQTLAAGSSFVFRGVLRKTGTGARYMEQPWFAPRTQYRTVCGTLQPKYRVVKGIGPARMRTLLQAALEETKDIRDDLPEDMRRAHDLMTRSAALRQIHFPTGRDQLAAARRRLIFDEFFVFILGVRRQKMSEGDRLNPRPMRDHADGSPAPRPGNRGESSPAPSPQARLREDWEYEQAGLRLGPTTIGPRMRPWDRLAHRRRRRTASATEPGGAPRQEARFTGDDLPTQEFPIVGDPPSPPPTGSGGGPEDRARPEG